MVTATITQEFSATWQTLADLISYLEPQEFERVQAAFEYARQMHGDQRRQSGELFFTHPVTVAIYLARYKLDSAALSAALLHDVAEDTEESVAGIAARFGDDVAQIVDGVTKFEQTAESIDQMGALTKKQIRDATLHKLFQFMIRDKRVVIIKLFDRLHNMQTMGAMPQEKRVQKVEETLYVYAPLANRLGMWELKNALQSLSLLITDPETFYQIRDQLADLYDKLEPKLTDIRRRIKSQLEAQDIPYIDVLPSPRNIYTVYERSRQNGHTKPQLDTVIRLVVVVPARLDCYAALGAVHAMWRPVPGTFDDYIAHPRKNLYRALHTTVMYQTKPGQKGELIKLRFRTEVMNIASDIGVLANWAYGDHSWSSELDDEVSDQVTDFLRTVDEDIASEAHDVTDGVQNVVEDILQARITVYTPHGAAKSLPEGATAIDFAYTVHTDVGDSCRKAYVNGRLRALNEPLHDGEIVEIVKFRHPNPQRIWLDEDLGFLQTGRARMQVRRHFRRLDTDVAIREGYELLQEELHRIGHPTYSHKQVAQWVGLAKPKQLYHALGRADVLVTTVATKVLTDTWNRGHIRRIGQIVESADGERFIINNAGNSTLRMCHSCNPRPGDNIVGFFRKDGNITVHKEACHTLPPDPFTYRLIRLAWGEEGRNVRLVEIDIQVHDRPHLLYEITDLLRPEMVNIASIRTERDRTGLHVYIGLEVPNARLLVRILHRIQALVNVRMVSCLPEDDDEVPGMLTTPFYHPE